MAEYRATQKYLIMSPRKLRLVADVARKMSPREAVDTLVFTQKRAAEPIVKVIKSAIANATRDGVGEDSLEFSEIQIGEGPRLKRWKPGARGRIKPYVRKMGHIRVVLRTKESTADRLQTTASKKTVEKKAVVRRRKAVSK